MPDNSEPATRADLEKMGSDLRAEIQASEARTKAEIARQIEESEVRTNTRFLEFEARMEGLLRDMETRLLQAFYTYVDADQKRHSATERTQADVIDRLANLENRVIQIEKRLNFPPAA